MMKRLPVAAHADGMPRKFGSDDIRREAWWYTITLQSCVTNV
jgi:hypothetical protein